MFRLLGLAFYAFHPASIRAYLQKKGLSEGEISYILKELVLNYKNKHREGIDQLREDICRSSNAGVFPYHASFWRFHGNGDKSYRNTWKGHERCAHLPRSGQGK